MLTLKVLNLLALLAQMYKYRRRRRGAARMGSMRSIYLRYQYKSTNTDDGGGLRAALLLYYAWLYCFTALLRAALLLYFTALLLQDCPEPFDDTRHALHYCFTTRGITALLYCLTAAGLPRTIR